MGGGPRQAGDGRWFLFIGNGAKGSSKPAAVAAGQGAPPLSRRGQNAPDVGKDLVRHVALQPKRALIESRGNVRLRGVKVTYSDVQKESRCDGLVVAHSGGVVPIVGVGIAQYRRQAIHEGREVVFLGVVDGESDGGTDVVVELVG